MRRAGDYLLLLAALAGAGVMVWQARQPQPIHPSLAGDLLWWLLAGFGLLGGLALRRMDGWLPDASPPASPLPFPGVARRGMGLLALVTALGLTGFVVVRLWPDIHQWAGTVLPWAAGLLLMLISGWLLRSLGGVSRAWGASPPAAGTADPPEPTAFPRWLELLCFLGILGLAIFLRIYRLDQIPPAIFVDETNAALDALAILEGRRVSPFATGWYETPNGFIYYMAGLFRLLGADYVSLKAVSLIPSILTVPAVYLLARLLFGPGAGLLAMFFFATSRWHLTMSRWAWNETAPPLFFALSAYFLIRGLRTRSALSYASGGLLGGLMIYTYLSSRLAVLTLILFAFYWLVADGEGVWRSWQRSWRGLLFYFLAALIAAAPLTVTYITQPFTFFNRSSEINIFREVEAAGSYEPLRRNIWNHVLLFYQRGDPNGRHNLPGEPQADPVTGILLAVGVGYALLRWRDRRRMLLLLWLAINLAGGYLSELHVGSPNSYRALNALVAVAILAGDSLDRVGRGLLGLLRARGEGGTAPPRMAVAGALLPVLLLAGFAARWEVDIYFGRQADSIAVQSSFNYTETQVAYLVTEALEEGSQVYLSPRFYHFSPLRFLVYGATREALGRNTLQDPPFSLARPEVDLPVPAGEGGALLLLDNYYVHVLDYVRFFYPEARIEQIYGPGQAPLFLQIGLSRDSLQALHGLTLQLEGADGAVITRQVVDLGEGLVGDARRATWQGSVRLERSGFYDFGVEGADLWVNDEVWTGPRYLGRGLHSLRLVQMEPTGAAPVLRWQPPGRELAPLPDRYLFALDPPRQGLTGRYYPNENWSGPPLLEQVTPFLLLSWVENEPMPHPFSATFSGQLRIEDPGFYNFRIEADDGVRLTLGGEVLGESLIPDRPNQVRAGVDLTAGLHQIRIDYFQRGGGSALEFFWQPPLLGESPVPPSALLPE